MSENSPKTVKEWLEYWSSLSADELPRQAAAANSATFVRTLVNEGYEAQDVTAIFHGLVQELAKQRLLPPGGGFYDLQTLLKALHSHSDTPPQGF